MLRMPGHERDFPDHFRTFPFVLGSSKDSEEFFRNLLELRERSELFCGLDTGPLSSSAPGKDQRGGISRKGAKLAKKNKQKR